MALSKIPPASVSDQPNTSTGTFDVPTGTTAQRPASPSTGMIRYNTTISALEQYDGSTWTAVGSGGAVSPSAVSDQINTSTGYFDLPAGTTAQRPASPAAGMVRYNTTTGNPEWYDPNATVWKGFYASSNYTAEYLIVAGGGGGGGAVRGGGGGAGGYRSSVVGESSGGGGSAEMPITFAGGTAYAITVGLGGASGPYGVSNEACAGSNGTNSSIDSTVISVGGGAGGSSDTSGVGRNPTSGGSGGGGWYLHGAGASGTLNQGYAGGTSGTSVPYGGGGGGAGGVGGNFNGGSGPVGGVGVSSLINGTATFRGGGGSSSNYQADSGYAGGNGGGGIGRNANGTTVGQAPSNGASNTGGGGGASGNGGSGVVIIRYAGAQRGTGGTVTSSGGYTIHTFITSGTYIA